MGLEDYSDNIDIGEGGGEKSQETAKEAQEKREKTSKSMAGIKATRKDEKKATKDNDFLYDIIVEVLKNREYDLLLPFIGDLLKSEIPSNFILGGLSLIYGDAAYIIRTNYLPGNTAMVYNKSEAGRFSIKIDYIPTAEIVAFDDNNINASIKSRINEWIEDIISVISFDPSTIVTKKFFKLLQNPETKNLVINYIAAILSFFLFRLNILISKEKAFLYSEFILSEALKKLHSLTLEEIDAA